MCEKEARAMQDGASICAMQHFHFGQRVLCSDGEAGLLTQLVFDSAGHRLIALGIMVGRWFGRRVYVSFTTVVPAAGENMTLRLSRAELAAASNQAPAGAELDRTSVVKANHPSGTTAQGTIHLLAVHPESGKLADLVAHHIRARQDTLFHEASVTQIETGQVNVSLPEATWQTLPPYRPDDQLQHEIEERLYDLIPFHVDFQAMHI